MTRIRQLGSTEVAAAGQLCAWLAAFGTGRAGADETIAAAARAGAGRVRLEDGTEQPFAAILVDWGRAGAAAARLVLPVPGDPRGLPGPDRLRTAAMTAGAAVIGTDQALVPGWTQFPAEPAEPDPLTLRETELELRRALRESAEALAGGPASRWHDGADAAAAALRQAGDTDLPPGHPAIAVGVIAQALRVRLLTAAALDVRADATLTNADHGQRTDTLRRLDAVARRALQTAYSAGAA